MSLSISPNKLQDNIGVKNTGFFDFMKKKEKCEAQNLTLDRPSVEGIEISKTDLKIKFKEKYTPPVFDRKVQYENGSIYEYYKGIEPESAKQFLASKMVSQAQYYIIVKTPDGNWGIDKEGLYLEQLLPWQKDIKTFDCEGTVEGAFSQFGLICAAKGLSDNFVMNVRCGKCNHVWTDGIGYNLITIVRCPHCKTENRIDSTNIKVIGNI